MAERQGAVELLDSAIVAAHAFLGHIVDVVWAPHPVTDGNAHVRGASLRNVRNVRFGQPQAPVTTELPVGLEWTERRTEALLVHRCVGLDRVDIGSISGVGSKELVKE